MSFLYHKKDGYFIEKMLTLMLSTEESFLSALINRYLMRSIARGDHRKIDGRFELGNSPQQIGKEFAQFLPEQELFSIHMAFHTYLYMCARLSADLVVDASKLARNRDYRVQVHHQIASVTGLHLNLDDATDTQQYHPFDPSFINWEEIRENLNFAVLTLDHLFDRQNLLDVGTELIDETLAEVQVSEKYLAKARDQIKTLTSERDSIKAAKDTFVTESDRLASERDAAIANIDRVTREWVAAATERDQLIADNRRLEGELAQATIAATQSASQIAGLRSEVSPLWVKSERLASELSRSDAARKAADAAQKSLLAALRADLARLCADRDRVAAQSERWFNAAAHGQAEMSSSALYPPEPAGPTDCSLSYAPVQLMVGILVRAGRSLQGPEQIGREMHANGNSPRVFSLMNSIGTRTPLQYGFSLATLSKRRVEFRKRRPRIVTRSASPERPSILSCRSAMR